MPRKLTLETLERPRDRLDSGTSSGVERPGRRFGSGISKAPTRAPTFLRLDGFERHHAVCPSRWCVTRQDLREFRQIVSVAVAEGRIVPNEYDEFDPDDNIVGPSIATVTFQLIVPLTSDAGNASWALSLRPEGLECDLFVTHCWKEGVYEFVDKVLHSWPRRASHAYCCMLSNPQNLDIGDLISSPESSPFAKALNSASYMLVVPNVSCSIYTRIWCVYEAYLAYTWEKPIFTASKPYWGGWFRVAQGIFHFAVSAIASCVLATRLMGFEVQVCLFWASMLMASTLGAATMYTTSGTLYAVNFFGGVVSGIFSGVSLALVSYSIEDFSILSASLLLVVPPRTCAVNGGIAGLIFALRESDRMWDEQARLEAAQLRHGYTGKLQDALASVATDRERILNEIREKDCVREVEQAIKVLIRAGMSTPGLRLASMYGIDVSGAGYWSSALALVVPFIFVIHPACHIVEGTSCGGLLTWVPWLKVAEGITWVLLFLRLDPDQRGFATLAGAKLGAMMYLTVWTLWVSVLAVKGDLRGRANCVPDMVGACVAGPLMLTVSALNIQHCLGVPAIGLPLVKLLLAQTGQAREDFACDDCCREMNRVLGADSTDSADDSDSDRSSDGRDDASSTVLDAGANETDEDS